jgi:hypothetical protein
LRHQGVSELAEQHHAPRSYDLQVRSNKAGDSP